MHEQMKRLYEAAKALKQIYGQSELARLLNISPQTIHNWQARGISKQGLLKAQEMVGCSALWLETGKGLMATSAPRSMSRMINNVNQIPLFAPEQVVRINRLSRQVAASGEPVGWLFTHTSLSSRAFALKVIGNSMSPEFEEGDWIIADPAVDPAPGDFVIARYGEKPMITLKKYRPKGLDASRKMLFELVPLNEDYPCLRSYIDLVEIIGTVVEQRRFRKKQ